MKYLLLLVVAAVVSGDDLPPSCSRPVYCNSTLLHHVQMARVFRDSKTFVDLQMRNDENTTLSAFQELLNKTNNNPPFEQIKTFVTEYFDETSELEAWTPTDYSTDPKFLATIRDESLRQFGKDINSIWPSLARKIKPIVFEKPDQFSIVPVSNGFIIPGGRFKEIYYWDAYWIIEGLLITGMKDTAKGMIENLLELLNKFGHIPNGSRWYYQERSQPPLLTAMIALYLQYTNDIDFLRANIASVEREMKYWLDTQIVTFTKDDRVFTLLRYFAPSAGPRPESYYEDYTTAQTFDNENDHSEFYTDIKSAAESGWDFSSRWFISSEGDNSGNLTNIHTKFIIPVDLNSIFAGALQNTANFHVILQNPRKVAHYGNLAKQWRRTIEDVLWHEKDGVWYDYDILNEKHRKYFYPTNVSPLWMGAVDKVVAKKHAPRVYRYLRQSQGLQFPGGIPSSLIRSGEQWDFPNAWPPLVSIVVNALEALGDEGSSKLALKLAQTWVRACHKGYTDNKQMFEKYDAETPGAFGGGGEYVVQSGFGWSNGVVLEFLNKYGSVLTAQDSLDDNAKYTSDSTNSCDD